MADEYSLEIKSTNDGSGFQEATQEAEEYYARVQDLVEASKQWSDAQQELAMRISAAQDEAKQLNEALDEHKQKLHEAADESEGLKEGLEQVSEHAENLTGALEGGLSGALKTAGEYLGGTGEAAAGLGVIMFGLAQNFANWGNNLANLNTVTGVSVGVLSSFGDTASVTGVSAETLGMASERLGMRFEQSADKVRKGTELLGISFDELQKASPDERIKMIGEAVAELGPESDKAKAAMMDLFGKSGLQLLPAFSKEAIEYRENIHHLVQSILGDEADAAKQAKEWKEAVNTVEVAFESVLLKLGQGIAATPKLLGAMSDVLDEWSHKGAYAANPQAPVKYDYANSPAEQYAREQAEHDRQMADQVMLDNNRGVHHDVELPSDAPKPIDPSILEHTTEILAPLKDQLKELTLANNGLLDSYQKQNQVIDLWVDKQTRAINKSKESAADKEAEIGLIHQIADARKQAVENEKEDAAVQERVNTSKQQSAAYLQALSQQMSQQASLQDQLTSLDDAALTPLQQKVQAIYDQANSQLDANRATLDALQTSGKITDADVDRYEKTKQLIDAIVQKKTAQLEANQAEVEAKTMAEESERQDLELEKAQRSLAKAMGDTRSEYDDQAAALDDNYIKEVNRITQLAIDKNLTDAETQALLNNADAIYKTNQQTLAVSSGQKQLNQFWSDAKGLMSDLGVSSSSTFGKIVGDVEKGIDAFSKLSDMIKNVGGFLSGIGGMLSKIFGGGGILGGGGAGAGGGLSLGGLGGIGGFAAGLAAPLGLFALNSLLGPNPADSEYGSTNTSKNYSAATGYQGANSSGGWQQTYGGVTPQQAAWNAANTPKYADGAWSVPSDQIAGVHANEMILPPAVAAFFRIQGGAPSSTGDPETRSLLQRVAAAVEKLSQQESHVSLQVDNKVLGDVIYRASKDGMVRILSNAVVTR